MNSLFSFTKNEDAPTLPKVGASSYTYLKKGDVCTQHTSKRMNANSSPANILYHTILAKSILKDPNLKLFSNIRISKTTWPSVNTNCFLNSFFNIGDSQFKFKSVKITRFFTANNKHLIYFILFYITH